MSGDRSPGGSRFPSRVEQAADFVYAALTGAPPDRDDWYFARPIICAGEAVGLSYDAIRRAAKRLGVQHTRTAESRPRVLWRLEPIDDEQPLRSVAVLRRSPGSDGK